MEDKKRKKKESISNLDGQMAKNAFTIPYIVVVRHFMLHFEEIAMF